MKITCNDKIRPLRWLLPATSLLLFALLAACAPAPVGDQSSELTRLREQQLQQQQTMLALQQQLAELQQQLATTEPPAGEAVSTQLTPDAEPPTEPSRNATLADLEDFSMAAGSYLDAFSSLAMGRYQQARDGFENFLRNYDAHRYAANARFWLAESQIALGLLQQAENNLIAISTDQHRQTAPAALLRLAQLYQQQSLSEQAEDILHQLRTRFPESREAQHFNRSNQPQ